MENVDLPRNIQTELKSNEYSKSIIKPEGTYTIIYGSHEKIQNPQDLPDKFDGLFLETGGGYSNNWLRKPNYMYFMQGNFHPQFGEIIQYKDLFPKLEKEKSPIYFADPIFNEAGFIYGLTALVPGLAAKGILGGIMLNKVREKISRKTYSRRDIAKLGIGAWLSSGLVGQLANLAAEQSGKGKAVSREISKSAEKLHPESHLLYVTFRNAVLSYKEEWLMHKLGNNPHFATIIGAAHGGIEDQIQTSMDEKLKFLQAIGPLIRKFVNPETFYSIARFEYDDYGWAKAEVFEIPEFKAIFDQEKLPEQKND